MVGLADFLLAPGGGFLTKKFCLMTNLVVSDLDSLVRLRVFVALANRIRG